MNKTLQLATLAAGCFWGIEDFFMKQKGIISTRVGYTGGHVPNATYKQVCTGNTGHAEAVEITFDPTIISYEQLLQIFFKIHDPTTPNRQGPDVGEQYRSVIFYHSDEQKKLAHEYKEALDKSKEYKYPIVTEIAKASDFWTAEEYHQKYFRKNNISNTCRM